MSYFLWVEDFEKSATVTADNVFAGIVDEKYYSDSKQELKSNFEKLGIYIELSLQDGLRFIQNDLDKVDYIILDIDLPVYSAGDEPNETTNGLLEEYYSAGESDDESESSSKRAELKKVAGYHIYTKLIMDLGFPKENILFCSDHGDQLKTMLDAFKTAKIKSPKSYQKSNAFVNNWVKERYENPYSRLRRGIIEGCKTLKDLPEENFQFKKYIEESIKQLEDSSKRVSLDDIHNYLDVLEKILPLREPADKASLYKLFVRTLAHEWDVTSPKLINYSNKNTGQYAFAWTMKITRNWMAHSKLFEQLTPQDVAYLFIVNMRAMFNLGNEVLAYEKQLLNLFSKPLSVEKMKTKIGEHPKQGKSRDKSSERKIPLEKYYAALLKRWTRKGDIWEATNYHTALNDLQKKKGDKIENEIYITGLYQIFWFLTSYGKIKTIGSNNEEFPRLEYKFEYFTYNLNYLFEIARHIYDRSFPTAKIN